MTSGWVACLETMSVVARRACHGSTGTGSWLGGVVGEGCCCVVGNHARLGMLRLACKVTRWRRSMCGGFAHHRHASHHQPAHGSACPMVDVLGGVLVAANLG
jgi:hypothetical protein